MRLIESVEAGPTDYIVCAGPPYEMGRLQGQAIAEEVAGCRDALRALEPFRLLQPRWLPYALFLRAAARKAERTLASPVANACPGGHRRLLGIAEGSAVATSDLWLLQSMEALLGSVGDVTDHLSVGACSTVWLDDSRSPVDEPLIAHNFDYARFVRPYLIVRESRPEDGLRSIEFTAAPLSGVLDGVNEAGLAVTYNYGLSIEPARPDAMVSMRISETLAQCETVDEALDLLQKSTRWGAGILMLADASGEAASLELTSTRRGVRRPQPEGVLLHTNKYHVEQTLESEVREDAVFSARAPASLRGERVLDSPKAREARLQALLTSAGRLDDLGSLQEIMADHGAAQTGSSNTICMHGDYLETCACVQCFPRSRCMRVSVGTACRAAFKEYTL